MITVGHSFVLLSKLLTANTHNYNSSLAGSRKLTCCYIYVGWYDSTLVNVINEWVVTECYCSASPVLHILYIVP